MTAFTSREVRAWAIANDVPCPGTGRLPQRVIDAYLLEVHGVTTDQAPQVQETDEEDVPSFTIDLHIPGADLETTQRIEALLLDVIWYAHLAGVRAERARLIASIGGDE